MALIVEDGSIVAGAESYITVAEALTFHAARGNTAWAALTETEQEIALRKACDYMLQRYRLMWQGVRVSVNQMLDWPRYDVFMPGVYATFIDSDIVPLEIRQANAILALKTLDEDLMPDTEQQVIREKIDVIEVEYDKNSPQAKRFRAVDALLTPYFNGISAHSRKLVR